MLPTLAAAVSSGTLGAIVALLALLYFGSANMTAPNPGAAAPPTPPADPKAGERSMADIEALIREGNERAKAMGGKFGAIDNRLKEMEAAAEARFQSLAKKGKESGLSLSRIIYATVTGDWSEAKAEREAGNEESAKRRERSRTMNVSLDSAGGYAVPEMLDAEMVELLRANSVVESLPGVRRLDNLKVSPFKMNRQATASTHSWATESGTVTPSNPTLARLQAEPHKSMIVAKLTSEMVMLGTVGENFVREDFARQIALGEDLGFIRGAGGIPPIGLAIMAGINTRAINGALTFDNLYDSIYDLAADNAPMRSLAWILNPRTWNSLIKVKDGDGRYILDPGTKTLLGLPYLLTTQMPINLTGGSGGSTDTEVLLVDGSEVILFGWGGLSILPSQHASASDGSSAFMQDEVWIRAVRHRDIGVRHLESVNRLTGVSN